MKTNAVVCAIEHVLRNDGCNEIPVSELFDRVKRTRGNLSLDLGDFLRVLRELEADGLFESFGDKEALSEESLFARSQLHPCVPFGDAIQL
jgi:hypothetical protein